MDDARIAAAILALVTARGASKSVCPSEVARALAPAQWRPLMSAVRASARQLAAAGRIELTRGERTLDPGAPLSGPIRLRLPRR